MYTQVYDEDYCVPPISFTGYNDGTLGIWTWSMMPHFAGSFEIQISTDPAHDDATSIAIPRGSTFVYPLNGNIVYARARSVTANQIISDWTDWESTGVPVALGGASTGGIDGPASSTDNGVVRWDGTAGDTIQDSDVLISDRGKVTFPDDDIDAPINITARSSAPNTPVTGDVYLDDGTNTQSGNRGWRVYTGSAWVDIKAGATSFLNLTDTPSSYSGNANTIPVINRNANGINFSGSNIGYFTDIGAYCTIKASGNQFGWKYTP